MYTFDGGGSFAGEMVSLRGVRFCVLDFYFVMGGWLVLVW